VHNLADPPVFPSSIAAVQALTRDGGFKKSQWSDPAKYSAQLASTKVIIATNVYNAPDASLVDRLLSPDEPLPPPPARVFREEPPALIMARRAAFNDLDNHLTRLVIDAGLREQPQMAFLRWGFNQRSLQSPALSYDEADPLLPMHAAPTDACLMMELVRERLSHKNSAEICAALAAKCGDSAAELIKLRAQLMGPNADATAAAGKSITLLYPHESHLHLAAGGGGAGSHVPGGYHARDRLTHNQNARDQYWLIYDRGGDSEYAIPLNHARFTKLMHDYERTTGPVGGDAAAADGGSSSSEARVKGDHVFLRRLWSMCARYDTISGAGYQAALPTDAFDVLRRLFGVGHESYASPLNHCLDSFGSAFIDTDRFFGSKGSFLEQRPLEGGFQCNPPFLEEVMAANAFHILALLERAQKKKSPLCFVCIWPGWDDCVAYDLLTTSRFLRKLICFEKGDHFYTDGLQHRVTDMKQVYRRTGARSFAFFLQTDAAAEKWPTNEERIGEFKRAFMQPRN